MHGHHVHHLETAEWAFALREVRRIVKPAGPFLLVDILFADEDARNEARHRLGSAWEEENYGAGGPGPRPPHDVHRSHPSARGGFV